MFKHGPIGVFVTIIGMVFGIANACEFVIS